MQKQKKKCIILIKQNPSLLIQTWEKKETDDDDPSQPILFNESVEDLFEQRAAFAVSVSDGHDKASMICLFLAGLSALPSNFSE